MRVKKLVKQDAVFHLSGLQKQTLGKLMIEVANADDGRLRRCRDEDYVKSEIWSRYEENQLQRDLLTGLGLFTEEGQFASAAVAHFVNAFLHKSHYRGKHQDRLRKPIPAMLERADDGTLGLSAAFLEHRHKWFFDAFERAKEKCEYKWRVPEKAQESYGRSNYATQIVFKALKLRPAVESSSTRKRYRHEVTLPINWLSTVADKGLAVVEKKLVVSAEHNGNDTYTVEYLDHVRGGTLSVLKGTVWRKASGELALDTGKKRKG